MFTASEILKKINSHIADLKFTRTPQGLYAPVSYVLSMGGKRIRPVLMLMSYNLYKEDIVRAYGPAIGIEVYHNYTLLHDDLMDCADRRRGKKTVHKVWNDNTAILSGDAMLVLAYQYMAQCPAGYLKEVMDLFSLTALEICEGQQMDMEFELRKDVKEGEYLEMIRLKTSVLLAASLKIGALLGGASAEDAEHLYNFGMNLGIAFQLKDDLLDVYGDAAIFGKNIGGDILCNKKTYMLIKAFEHADDRQLQQLKVWVDAGSFEPAEKIAAVTDLYNQIGIKEICEKKMAEYSERAMENLVAVKVADEKKKELEILMGNLMNREV
ncbi:polyprenyl synthetase family protein [Bacteroides helcogenes]|uniref:Polyprenyl synthetase n=1 Tax=Bacteroides helcogenes (strain ATCC 35417 / DSM 20613 / JCM 6297 / CCUG 15421 / P 36-108) TaxID=693979 RepID=E6ST27_BACT6|nr:polyprenyl synthetase family protein [Bacteroides helcogenes]ADV45231.1 Polyprenyl synthetase [Bacteroides helcogenes P 36-108]MDY5238792.1 polyprenyl synthetase family protein [Bacteroides helcogenes]